MVPAGPERAAKQAMAEVRPLAWAVSTPREPDGSVSISSLGARAPPDACT